jgi:LCCL domain
MRLGRTTSSLFDRSRSAPLGVLALALVAASCSSTTSGVTAGTAAVVTQPVATTVAAAATPAVTAAATTAAVTAAATTPSTVPKTVAPTAAATTANTTAKTNDTTAATAEASSEPWAATATAFHGKNGTKVSYTCPPGGPTASVWGTETYTEDSSVCTAAVHVGLITVAAGGTVEIQIAPGLDRYSGTAANGVDTSSYGSWGGSFIFPAAPPGSGHFAVGPESWNATAAEFRGQNGKRETKQCSPTGTIGTVWGTGTYTDDSSICSAAVLEGLITTDKGGQVVIQIAAGAQSYTGSTANGVTSQDYGSWEGSFLFPKDQTSH